MCSDWFRAYDAWNGFRIGKDITIACVRTGFKLYDFITGGCGSGTDAAKTSYVRGRRTGTSYCME